MSKFKTYPRGQRKEFELRCLTHILNAELKKFYLMRQDYDKFSMSVDESDLVSQLDFIKSLVSALEKEVKRKQDYYINHQRIKY